MNQAHALESGTSVITEGSCGLQMVFNIAKQAVFQPDIFFSEQTEREIPCAV